MNDEREHPWNAVGVIPTLNVTDVDEAVKFYKMLHFEEEWRFPVSESNGDSHSTHVGMSQGDISIILALHDGEEDAIQLQEIYIVMENVRAFHESLVENFDDEIEDLDQADYGMLDFSISDPWGHLLTFGEANVE